MNSHTMHTFAVSRQREFLAEADHARHAKQARAAARGTQAPGRHPLIWLRDAAGTFASRLASPTRAHDGSH
jgi:hypothetical protein